MNAFNNKTVLITGGTDGIGKELVLQFLQLGAKVITCGRSQQKILALESESPVGNLSVINADVSNEKDCERMVNHAISQFGEHRYLNQQCRDFYAGYNGRWRS